MGPRGGDELNLILPGTQLRLADRLRTARITTASTSPTIDPADGFEAPKLFWIPSISPTEPADLHAAICSRSGRATRFIGALSGQALIRVRIRRRPGAARPTNGTWATASAASSRGRTAQIYLLEDGAGARLLRLTPGSDAAIAQIIRPAALAARLGAVAGFDPAARRFEEVLGPFGQPFELLARGAASPSATS